MIHFKTVLSYLIRDNLIPKKIFNRYKGLFKYYGLLIPQNKKNKQRPNSDIEENYFKIRIYSIYSIQELEDEIYNNFEAKSTGFYNVILIHLKYLDKFIEFYKNEKRIDWTDFSSQTNIGWTNILITKYQGIWDWKTLQENPSIKWNLDLVKCNLYKINWRKILEKKSIVWDIKSIEEFIEHLPLTNKSEYYYFFSLLTD